MSESREALAILVERWRDGLASAEESSRLAQTLQAGDTDAQWLAEYLRLDGHIAVAIRSCKKNARKTPQTKRIATSRPYRPTQNRAIPWMLAAGVLLTIGLGILLFHPQDPGVWIETKGHRQTLTLGEENTLPIDASIVWKDGSRLEILSQVQYRLEKPIGSVQLLSGKICARIAPQNDPMGFRIFTPAAEIQVLGTVFTVEVAAGTKIAVEQGRVRVTSKDATIQELRAQESLSLSANGHLETPSGTKEEWNNLVISDALSGWNPLRGTWSAKNQTLIGTTGSDQVARIETLTQYSDLNLRGRIRFEGVKRIEIQMRDYSAWALIDATALNKDWHEFVLCDQGGILSASLDGQALPIEPTGKDSDGANRKSKGPLAFYLRGSGTVWIEELKVKVSQ